MERMFDPSPNLCLGSLHRDQQVLDWAFAHRFDLAALDRDMPRRSLALHRVALLNAGVARIAKRIRLVAMQQRVGLRHIGRIGCVPTTLCTKPDDASTPICAFIPKCHSLPFLV